MIGFQIIGREQEPLPAGGEGFCDERGEFGDEIRNKE